MRENRKEASDNSAENRCFKGRPTEFDIFEGYVRYKVLPRIPEDLGSILCDLEDRPTELSESEIEERLFQAARNCAIGTALKLGSGVIRAGIGEDSDLLYADCYLVAVFLILTNFKDAGATREKLSTHLKIAFRNDINYLILAPDAEIKHIHRTGWAALEKAMRGRAAVDERARFASILAIISQHRLQSSSRPYSKSIQQTSAENLSVEKLNMEISDSDYSLISEWIGVALNAQDTFAKTGRSLWLDW